MADDIKILVGNAHPTFGKAICQNLGVEPIEAEIGRHPDGEVKVNIKPSLRGQRIFVVQPTCPPVDRNYIELFVLLDALERASVGEIRVVMPYYGYARQERKTAPHQPISASLMASLIKQAAGEKLGGIITIDLHAGAIQGFFKEPVDHILSWPPFRDWLKQSLPDLNKLVVVAPDVGATERNTNLAINLEAPASAPREISQSLDAPLPMVVVQKARNREGKSKPIKVIGEVKGKTAFIFDDLFSTGGTLVDTAIILEKEGASRTLAGATHGLYCGDAIERIKDSPIEKVASTDTIPATEKELRSPKFERISVAEMFASIIRRIHNNESVSAVFPSN